jgi:hypothetical protein
MQPMLSMPVGGLRWLYVVSLVFATTILLALGALLLSGASGLGIATMLAVLLLTDALIYLIVPRRYEIYADRLRLVFPAFAWNIGFESLAAFRPASWWQSYGYWGIRFATAPSQAIEIRRRSPSLLRRPNLVISPADRETFLAQLSAAYATFTGRL